LLFISFHNILLTYNTKKRDDIHYYYYSTNPTTLSYPITGYDSADSAAAAAPSTPKIAQGVIFYFKKRLSI
jgi:hypothetical protein